MNDHVTRSCPRCRVSCVERAQEGVTVDICPDCSGIFLDESEFDQLVAMRFAGTPLESLFAFMSAQVEDPIDCAACGAAMDQLQYEGIEIDRCPECAAIWIDGHERGEFARVASDAAREQSREEIISCDGCGERVPLRICIRRMDAYWCEACVVAGNHPGTESQLVGIYEMKGGAAMALAKGRMRQASQREQIADRLASRDRVNRRFKPAAADLTTLEIIAHWIVRLFGRE